MKTMLRSFAIFMLVVTALDAQIPSSNLTLHLKADAGTSTTTDGAALSSWADQSGNGNDAAQPTGGLQPVYKTSVINGNPVIRFDGSTSYLTLPTPSALGIQNSEYDMFIVARSANSGIQFLTGGGVGFHEIHLNGSAGARFIPNTSPFVDKGIASHFTDGNAYMFNATAGSSSGVLRVNGYTGGDSSMDSRSSNNSALNLGRRGDGTYFLNGDIAEVIIYNTVLSASDRAAVESYLATKYGFTLSVIPTANLRMHLRADAGTSTATDGVAISSWTDKTLNNFNASQGSGAYQPVYKTGIINGKPVVRFTGSSALSLSRPSAIGIRNSPYDIFIVARSVANGSPQFLLAGGSEQFEYHLDAGTGSRFIPKTGSYVDHGANTNYTNGAAHIFQMSASSTIGINRVNGLDSVSLSADVRSSVDSNLALGFRPNEGYFLNGDIAEVIIYNTVLSHTDRVAVLQYLSERYGVGIYSLTVNTTGTGSGTVAKSPDQSLYAMGSTVTLSANPNSTSAFVFWSGDTSGSQNPRTIFMNGNKTVTATINSGYFVNSISDVDTGTGNAGTLRYVLNAINSAAPGTTTNVYMLSLSGTITLTSALPPLNYSMILHGPGENVLTISGNNLFRPFFVGAGTAPFSAASPAAPTVTMKDFTVSNGKGLGGSSHLAFSAGGGAGMGGAIFINYGVVTIQNVRFNNNSAIGGIGGNSSLQGGGGGGFGGDGQTDGIGGSSGLLGEAVGGGNGGNFTLANGQNGGFGGGGGSARSSMTNSGGSGGFGGGGGSGASLGSPGAGGFAAGNGTGNYGTGGGGAGLGGAIFNRYGNLFLFDCSFDDNTALGGASPVNSGTSYGGALFNFGGTYYFQNVTYGTGENANFAANSPNESIYSGSLVLPTATVTPATNVAATSATINGTVNTNEAATTYRFVYGTVASALSDTLGEQSAGSSDTVEVSANLSGLNYGTFYYFRLLTSNEYGADTSDLGSFIFDTTISSSQLALWLTADQGVDTAGGAVSGWYDRSGNNNNSYQSASANKPLLQSNSMNGQPVVRFNGSTSFMNLPTAATLGIQNEDYEMFIVARSSSAAIQFLIGTDAHYELHLNGGIGVRYIASNTPYIDMGSDNQYSNGAGHIFNSMATGTIGAIRVDGTAGSSSLTDRRSSSGSTLVLGRRASGSYYFNGDIAEVIIYTKELSPVERLAVNNYLSQKYGISYSTVSEPAAPSTAMTISEVTNSSMKVTVTKGNGAQRIILAKSGGPVDGVPVDGKVYTANAAIGSGSQIGTGNFVVYKGTDSVVTISNLDQNTAYHFASFEFNGANSDENYASDSPATADQTTTSTPAVAAVLAAENVTSAGATLRGVVQGFNNASTYRFAYGTDHNALTSLTDIVNLSSNASPDTVSAAISGLTGGVFYYYALIASNSGGTDTSDIAGVHFDTTSIPSLNLKLWLAAGKGIVKTDSVLSSWLSLAPGVVGASQYSASARPYFKDSIVNNKPVVRFNGTNAFLRLPSTSSLGIQNSEYEMYIVAKTASGAVQFLVSGQGENYEVHLNGGVGVRYIPKSGVAIDKGSEGAYADGQLHLFNPYAASTRRHIRVDGEIDGYTSADGRSTAGDTIHLGRRYSGAYYFNGDVAELIVYDTVLSAGQRQVVSEYLASKYGMSILPNPVEPTVQTTALIIENITSSSMKVTVTKGNGMKRMIIAKQGIAVDTFPSDNDLDTANASFGNGTQLGSGNYVVYRGTDSVVTVTNLNFSTNYHFAAVEFNGSNMEEDFLLTGPATGSQTTAAAPPVVTAPFATEVGAVSMTVKSTVNPLNEATTFRIAYGTDSTSFSDTTAAVGAGSGSTADTVAASISGLMNNTLYYAKIIATNTGGTTTTSSTPIFTDTSVVRSGLKFWLRADKATSTTVEDAAVTRWSDISGNGMYAWAPESAPFFNNVVPHFNNKPAIIFNGTSSYLRTNAATSSIGIQNSDYEIFIVAMTSTTVVTFLTSTPSFHYEMHLNGGLGVRYIPGPGSYYDMGTNTEYATNSPHLFGARTSSDFTAVSVDGYEGTFNTMDMRSSVNEHIDIGRRAGNSYHWAGYIAEMLIYNRNLSFEERQKVAYSLGGRYGIESLPVELISFAVGSRRLNAELKWKTATEVNNHGFEVERKMVRVSEFGTGGQNPNSKPQTTNQEWVKSGFVEGNGNSNVSHEYTFTDRDMTAGKYLFRLKQIDRDGKFSYSKEIEVEVGSVPKVFALEQNYPNPFNPATTIGFTLQESGLTTLKVYDIVGGEVTTLVNEHLEAGVFHQYSFHASGFASGMYFVRLTSGTRSQLKKMLMIK